jgi:hypothetical protein
MPTQASMNREIRSSVQTAINAMLPDHREVMRAEIQREVAAMRGTVLHHLEPHLRQHQRSTAQLATLVRDAVTAEVANMESLRANAPADDVPSDDDAPSDDAPSDDVPSDADAPPDAPPDASLDEAPERCLDGAIDAATRQVHVLNASDVVLGCCSDRYFLVTALKDNTLVEMEDSPAGARRFFASLESTGHACHIQSPIKPFIGVMGMSIGRAHTSFPDFVSHGPVPAGTLKLECQPPFQIAMVSTHHGWLIEHSVGVWAKPGEGDR